MNQVSFYIKTTSAPEFYSTMKNKNIYFFPYFFKINFDFLTNNLKNIVKCEITHNAAIYSFLNYFLLK